MATTNANHIRVINYNICGAKSPGRRDHATQERAWHLLAAYGADLALVQEAEIAAIPPWAKERWLIVHGDRSRLGGNWQGWGSVIAASSRLNPKPKDDLVDQGNLKLIYDYAVFAQVDLPDGTQALVSSVHAPARRLDTYLELMNMSDALSAEEKQAMAQPGEKPWALDLFFSAISAIVTRRRFIVGGDWNNSRLFDLDPKLRKRGQLPFSTMFFTRARDAAWFECHGGKNEERSFLREGMKPHQLDHLFCDRRTFDFMQDSSVRAEWVADELSDHAPLVTDFKWS